MAFDHEIKNHGLKKPTLTSVSRRGFVTGAASLLAAPALAHGWRGGWGGHPAEPRDGLFTLGVMSGEPTHSSVVLWTRLAPDPLNGGGMGHRPVEVEVSLALDPEMRHVIRRGRVHAHPRSGHAVHMEARRLRSNRTYFYQFRALGDASPVGRTRTFPGYFDPARPMRFAFTSCQHYGQGFYAAWRDIVDMAAEGDDLDFVMQVGDYIYESGASGDPILGAERNHTGGEIFSVEDYRNRYALYRLDPNLQQAQALYPFIVTPDDHEVDNNYAGEIAEEGAPYQGEAFLERRRNAYRVYAETMPLRRANRGGGRYDSLQLFRTLSFGRLADIHVFDTRQFRTDQPGDDGFGSTSPASTLVEDAFGEQLYDVDGEIGSPGATMMGARQERWLARSLRRSRAQWNLLAQQVMVMPWNLRETARLTALGQAGSPEQQAQLNAVFQQIGNIWNIDAWDGYPAARQRLYDMLTWSRASNPVVLTGDIHSSWGANLLEDPADPNSRMLAAEFVCTSIASTFLTQNPTVVEALVRESVRVDNPHIEYFNGLFRGYCLCDVDEERFQTSYRSVLPGGLSTASPTFPLEFGGLLGQAAALGTDDTVMTALSDAAEVFSDAVLEVRAGFNLPGSSERVTVTSNVTKPIADQVKDAIVGSLG